MSVFFDTKSVNYFWGSMKDAKIRDRAKLKFHDKFLEVASKLWDCYRADNKKSFSQRIRRLGEWCEAHPDLPAVIFLNLSGDNYPVRLTLLAVIPSLTTIPIPFSKSPQKDLREYANEVFSESTYRSTGQDNCSRTLFLKSDFWFKR